MSWNLNLQMQIDDIIKDTLKSSIMGCFLSIRLIKHFMKSQKAQNLCLALRKQQYPRRDYELHLGTFEQT